MRRTLAPGEPLANARLRTGGQLTVLDAASWGALAETEERLLPGRHLDVHIISAIGRILMRARVARAYVWELRPDAIRYRAALAFEHPIDVRAAGYGVPAPPISLPISTGTSYPERSAEHEDPVAARLIA